MVEEAAQEAGTLKTLMVAAALAAMVSIPAPSQARQTTDQSSSAWAPIFKNIRTAMDTPEPPDGHFATNTTGCVWNDEDQYETLWTGDLQAGSEASGSVCLVADLDGRNGSAYPKLLIGRVYAPKDSLAVWLTNDQGDRWDASPPIDAGTTSGGSRVVYQFCVPDQVARDANVLSWRGLSFWPLVPGTFGYGRVVVYTIHVRADAATRKVSAYFEAAFNGGVIADWGPVIQFLPPGEVPCPQ